MISPGGDDVWGSVEPDNVGSGSVMRVPPRVGPAPAVETASSRGPVIAGIVIIVLLCAVCLGLAYQSGAYNPRHWLPSLIGAAALAIVVIIAGPGVPSGRFQKILLALFGLQAVWTAASILWATSQANAWEEINRTLFYAVAVALVFAAVRWAGRAGLKALALLIAAVAAIVALQTALGLAVSSDPDRFFVSGRLNYPIGYFNALACFWMIGFWLSLGMANAARHGADAAAGSLSRDTAQSTPPGGTMADSYVAARRAAAGRRGAARAWEAAERFPRWVQPLLLALAVFLAEMALLPQSRGALWTFFLVIPFFVILSPNRFRALVDLGIVVLPIVLFWDKITGVYSVANDADAALRPALADALEAVGFSVLIVIGAWAVTWLVERWLAPLSKRAVRWIGIVLIVLFLAGAAGSLVYADHRTGGLGGYLDDRWEEVISDTGTGGETGSRFSALALNGRWTQWKVAAEAFRDEPLLGIGAQNFELYHYQHRVVEMDVKQPHSQIMQLLSELGLPGLVLWVAFVLGTLVFAVRLRFRPVGRVTQAAIAAIMTAAISWFIHSSADWLWQMAATSLPAMMLFAGLLGAGESGAPATSAAAAATTFGPRWWVRLVRPLAVVLALVVIVSAALPYLSLKYSDMAVSAKTLDKVTARTETAAKIDPTSVMPFIVRADSHRIAAAQFAEGSPDRVAEFELEAAAWVDAIGREPGYWLYYCSAAKAFLAARDSGLMLDPDSADELTEQARAFLVEARRLNPLSSLVTALEKGLEPEDRNTD